jgi:hypothetical protein
MLLEMLHLYYAHPFSTILLVVVVFVGVGYIFRTLVK